MFLGQPGLFKIDAKRERYIASEVIAANRQTRGKLKALVVKNHQIGGVRADIHKCRAFVPVFRDNGGVVRGHRLEDRFFHRHVSLVDRGDKTVVFLNGPRDQVSIGFQALRQHAARIPVPGLILHDKILRKKLQNHTVLAQLHMRSAVERTIYVTLFNFPGPPQLDTAPAIGSAHSQPAEPDYCRLDRHLRAMLRLV